MPLAKLYILECDSPEKKKQLIKEVSKAISNSFDVPLDKVRVILNEVSKQNWGVAGITIDEHEGK